MTNHEKLETIVRLIRSRATWPSQRFLDVIYGPQAKQLRAEIATILNDKPVTPSHKLAQYGQIRVFLYLLADVTNESCIAARDGAFELKARSILGELTTEES